MAIFNTIATVLDHAPAWLTAITATVSSASAITALTPTPQDDRILSRVLGVLNVLALNIGHARRKP